MNAVKTAGPLTVTGTAAVVANPDPAYVYLTLSEIRVQELSGNVTDSILDQTIEFALAKPTGEI